MMYDFHYNFIKKKFDAELLFTNADSLAYEIRSENVYNELFKRKICSILVIIQKIRSFMMIVMKKLLAK